MRTTECGRRCQLVDDVRDEATWAQSLYEAVDAMNGSVAAELERRRNVPRLQAGVALMTWALHLRNLKI